jgi:hypothetical protein
MPKNQIDPEDKNQETTEKDDKSTKKEVEGRLPGGIKESKLMAQVQHEYKLAFKHQQSELEKDLLRLKLYNNQKRDKELVGDTTMFSIFQTVLASLYDDRLMVDFRGKEAGDDETADNLDALAEADYDDMEKDVVDYDWDWDTCFFGRGLLLLEEYERDPDTNTFIPIPEVIDPTTFLRDPRAVSVNGNRQGKGAMRFGGREIKINATDIKDHPSFFKDIKIDDIKHGSSTYSLVDKAQEARDEAMGNNTTQKNSESDLGDNAEFSVTEWFTQVEIGGKLKKVKTWWANDRSKLLGFKVFKRDYFPIVDRPLYPTSHSWRGTSIPDLTEDKQRARAIAQNLGLKNLKSDLYPMYIYDTNKVTNRNDLTFDFDKGIGIDADPGVPVGNSVVPLQKSRPNLQLLQFIYDSLDASAQKATATPDIKMGIQSQKDRPLGETNLLSSNVDTRYSLGMKVWGWSEKRFWQQWYHHYKDNFADDIDEKVLRTVGAFGSKWRPLSKEDIIAHIDPDIYIESKAVNRAKDMEDRQMLTEFFQMALADPTVNRRWGFKKLAKLNGLQKDEIDRLFPPTIDERVAEDQNELLNEDKLVPVLPEDDHNVHLELHAMARDTDAAKAHIETHKKALTIKKVHPEWFPENEMDVMMNNEDVGGAGAEQGVPNMPQMGGGRPRSAQSNVAPSMTSNQV